MELPYASYECDRDGVLHTCGEGILGLSGYSAADLQGETPPLTDLILPADRPRVIEARRSVAADEALTLEYRIQHREGRILWIGDHACARGTGDDLRLFGVLVDLGVFKERGSKREQDIRLAALGGMATGVAHEVNNPLSGILNYAQLAQRLPPDDPRLAEALQGIVDAGKRILGITQSLLTFASNGRDGGLLAPEELLRAALTVYRRQLRDEFIIIDVAIDPDLPSLAIPGQDLQLALGDVLVSARAALNARFPKRSPDKRLEIGASCIDSGQQVEVELRVFFTAHGDGLELENARDLVERHAGALTVESEADRGTTIRMRMPVS